MTSELLKPALFYAIGVALQSVYETVSKDMQARLRIVHKISHATFYISFLGTAT
jgi:hypothetical protein